MLVRLTPRSSGLWPSQPAPSSPRRHRRPTNPTNPRNYLKEADATKSPDESASNLLRAIAQCDVAVRIDSGSFRLQGMAAHCYYRLAQLERAPSRRRDLIQRARGRFDRAPHCPDVEPACLREWAEMLMAECNEP
jgi:hypothetical protein